MPAEDHHRGRSSPSNSTLLDHHVDTLARGLASDTISRREAVRLMGAALLGSALASIPGMAWAKPKPGKCNHDKQCPGEQTCVDGQCFGCPPGYTLCSDGLCYDLTTNNCNCGTCGNNCSEAGGGKCCGPSIADPTIGVCGGAPAGSCPPPTAVDYCKPGIEPT
jgi:hypothetical protein